MSRFKKATLTDVARRAGVSVTTASYILNGRSSQMRISAATEDRVQTAMHELGYRPNRSARTLRGSSTRTIGVISDFVASGEYATRLLSGVNAAARRHDHVVLIGETLGNTEMESLLIEEMVDRQVDGLLYVTLAASSVDLPEVLRQGRTVLLNCLDPGSDLPAVVPDDELAGRMAAEHLLAAEVAHAVFVVGEDPTPESTAGPERLRGISGALTGAGAELAGVVPCPWEVENAFAAVDAWLDTRPGPSALICLNDRVAMGTYQALAEHDLRVSHDVSVISFDGSDLSSWLRPRLTSLALPFVEMGTRAVEILMDAGWREAGVTRLPPTLQRGTSV